MASGEYIRLSGQWNDKHGLLAIFLAEWSEANKLYNKCYVAAWSHK